MKASTNNNINPADIIREMGIDHIDPPPKDLEAAVEKESQPVTATKDQWEQLVNAIGIGSQLRNFNIQASDIILNTDNGYSLMRDNLGRVIIIDTTDLKKISSAMTSEGIKAGYLTADKCPRISVDSIASPTAAREILENAKPVDLGSKSQVYQTVMSAYKQSQDWV